MQLDDPTETSKLPTRREKQIVPAAVEEEPKYKRPRRARPLPGLTRKFSEMAAQVVEMAIKEEARNDADLRRLKALCEVVFSGAFSTMLRNSTLLSPEDKDFLKDMNCL